MMKHINKSKIIRSITYTFCAAILALAGVVSGQTTANAAGSMYLAPSSASVQINTNITLSLRINPGTPVTVVQATVNFDSQKLAYVGVDASGSHFDTNVQQTVGSNSVTIARAKLDPAGVGYDALIANITFKAVAGSGSSVVSLSGANAAFDGAYTNPGTSGSTISFTTPAPVTTTPGNQGAPSQSTSTKKPADNKKDEDSTTKEEVSLNPPKLTKAVFQYTVAKLSASTEQDVSVQAIYGVSPDELIFQTDLTPKGKNHTINITKDLPIGAKIYHRLVAVDGDKRAETDVQKADTQGLSMRIALMDKNLQRIKNTKVVLKPIGIEATSDKDGYVDFVNLPPGDYTVEIASGNSKHAQYVNLLSNVKDGDEQSSALQTRAVVFDGYESPSDGQNGFWSIVRVVIIAVLVLGLGVVGYILWRRFKLGKTANTLNPWRAKK